jgi:hypothetical protein
MLIKFLRLFAFVRDLESRLKTAIESRLVAEARAVESSALLREANQRLQEVQAQRVAESQKVSDFITKRFMGIGVFSGEKVELSEADIGGPIARPRPMPRKIAAEGFRRQVEQELNEKNG